jgi:EmrB/QacA subfamily drug resistance transporter
VNVALPSAQRALDISDADRQWMVTAYTLSFGGLLLLGGRIADYAGRKRTFTIGLLGFAVASAIGGLAPDAALLFAARAAQGGFAALLAPAALSLITVMYTEPSARARAFSLYGAISGSGGVIGLLLGGILTTYASWRWCLLVNLPLAIAAAVAGRFLLTESRAASHTSYDVPGTLLVTSGLAGVIYGFNRAATPGAGWTASSTWLLLAAGVALLASFIAVEVRTSNPLLPLRVLLDRNRGGAFLAALLVSASLFAMFLFLTFYFQQNLHYSAVRCGFAFLPFAATFIIVASGVSLVLPRTGPKPLMACGTVLAALGILSFTRITNAPSWAAHVLPGELFAGAGMSLVFVPMAALALVGVAENDSGVASAVLNTFQQIGGALGTSFLTTVFAGAASTFTYSHRGPSGRASAVAAQALIHGYHAAFLGAFLILVGAFLAVALLIKTRGNVREAPARVNPANVPIMSHLPGCAVTIRS